MVEGFSAAQLAKIYNAVTDGKPVNKFESKARAMALTQKELDRMGVSVPVALARAGFPVPAETTPMEPEAWNARHSADVAAAVTKLHADCGATAGPEAIEAAIETAETERQTAERADEAARNSERAARLAADYDAMRAARLMPLAVPANPNGSEREPSERFVRMALDAVNGEPVALHSLHGPVRTVDGDPEKAARKVAAASVVELRQVRQAKAAEMPAPAPVKPAEAPAMRSGAKRTAATMGPVIAALRSAGGATLAECTTLAGWDAPFELRNLQIAARKRGATIVKLADGAYRLTGGEG